MSTKRTPSELPVDETTAPATPKEVSASAKELKVMGTCHKALSSLPFDDCMSALDWLNMKFRPMPIVGFWSAPPAKDDGYTSPGDGPSIEPSAN